MDITINLSNEAPEEGGLSEWELLYNAFVRDMENRVKISNLLLAEIESGTITDKEEMENIHSWFNENKTVKNVLKRLKSSHADSLTMGSMIINPDGIMQLNEQKPGSEQVFDGN